MIKEEEKKRKQQKREADLNYKSFSLSFS